MLKEFQLKHNNLHLITDNIRKIQTKREKTNSKSKQKNISIQVYKNNTENSFNDINNSIGEKKLSKVNSYSRQVWENNKNNDGIQHQFKKGKSTTSLKIKRKINNSNTNIIVNNNTKNNSNSVTVNNNKTYKFIKKTKTKVNNISTPNTENNLFTINNTNQNTNNSNNTNNNIDIKNKLSLTSKLNSNLGEKSQNVKVFIRFRPSNELETSLLQNNYGWLVPKFISQKQLGIYTKNTYEYNSPTNEIPNNYIFSYDKVFSPNSNQSEIYTNVGKRIVEDIMAGYNGTIFAYGQSGSGKTFTMYGNDIYDENAKGIIPRVVEEIFKRVEKSDRNIDFQIKLSVLEIYKEVMYDLFTQENNLRIIENKEKGIYIENLTEVYLSSIEEFFNYVELSQKNRKVAETKLNHNSSRSHCIMILEVVQNDKKEKIIKKGTLNLVDLAGSEKVSKTGAVGETLEEAKKINLSLSTLGNVIHSLTQGTGHVPFRDSKLTRILKESLGGNYKTYLIVTCSPHSYNLDEIISSLLFAKRVKCIKNKYKINIKYSYEELQNLVDKLNEKLLIANEKIFKLINGGKINIEEEKKLSIKHKSINSFICKNCILISKEKKILENKVQELMDTIQEKESEISKLKEELQELKNKNGNKEKDKENKQNNLSSLKTIPEINNSMNIEEKKTNELLELYQKIKDKLSKIEEENERIKIIQNEEEEIRKINLKKESFNKIIQDFIKNKDKIKCFEKMDGITKISIPYVKDKAYKNLFNEFKNNIYEIFPETNNISSKKMYDSMRINLFFEYMHFYFSQQIINQGYLKLILDNNSLYKMNKYLFDIVNDVLTQNIDIANENAMNVNAINYLRASLCDSFVSKPSNNINLMNDLNQKIIKVVPKKNLNLKNSYRMNTLNNFIHDNNNNINNRASFTGSIQGYDFKNSIINFSNENYAAYINKLKSHEFEKSSNKIQMIRNVLVSIIKETDYIRNDIKDLKDNLNITIKNIMNYFANKIFNNEVNELDIKDNNIFENDKIFLKSKYNTESYNNILQLNNPRLVYKSENNNIFRMKNKDSQTNDSSINIENINPNTFESSKIYYSINNNVNKTVNLTANPSANNIKAKNSIKNKKLKGNNSNKIIKNNCLFSKLIKQNENENSLNILNTFETGTVTRKYDNLGPIPKKINQAKGDIVENANYFVLTQS